MAWSCAQRLRAAYQHPDPREGKKIAVTVVESFPTCPIPEIARLGRTLKQWRAAFLAYFDTGRSSNGGTEAVNGLIELHRRIARGFRNRDNYRLRMLLIAGGLTRPPPQVGRALKMHDRGDTRDGHVRHDGVHPRRHDRAQGALLCRERHAGPMVGQRPLVDHADQSAPV